MRQRILTLLSSAGGGDRQPVIALARRLAARGHVVSLWCDEPMTAMARNSGLPFDVHPVEQVGYISQWIGDLDSHPANPLVAWADDAMPFAVEAASSFRPDVVLTSLFTLGLARHLAAELRVPSCFVNPSFYFGDGQRRGWEDDWHGPFVPRLARECFWPLVREMDLVLHATDPGFDPPPQELPPGHHYVGFLHWEQESVTPAVLDEPGHPWVLVTASTARPGDEAVMLAAALRALEGRDLRVILTMPREGRAVPETSNSVRAGYVPHSPVLSRSAMCVSHAGHGIVSKCIVNGVPMVLLPWDADQPGVAARAAAAGVAVVVPRDEVTPDTVRQAVDELSTSHHAATARTLQRAVATCAGVSDPVGLVESL